MSAETETDVTVPQNDAAPQGVHDDRFASHAAYWIVPDVDGHPSLAQARRMKEGDALNTFCVPVMPMYDLVAACALIPIGDSGLRKILRLNKGTYPARYRKTQNENGTKIRIRLLSAAEIRHIRRRVMFGPGAAYEDPQ